jgi:cysteine-rich repeat protein
MVYSRRLAIAAAIVFLTSTANAQDTCDVLVQLDEPGPLGIATFGIEYSGAGGDFFGDSSIPGFGPSWGTTALACTSLVAVDEVTLIDDNIDTLSMFFAEFGGLPPGPVPLASCVFTLDSGFPCPGESEFTIVDASFPDDPFPPPFPLPSAPAVSLTVSPRTPVCGDGFREGTEECDDGNTISGDCCSTICDAAPAGTACEDGSVCTLGETCSDGGSCVAASTVTCDDGVFCTLDRCDPTGGCVSEAVPNRTSTCPGHGSDGKIDLRDSATNDDSDSLRLNLKLGGEGDIGNPASDTDYAICVYDSSGGQAALVDALEIPAGGAWSASGGSGNFGYNDKLRLTEGIEKIRLVQSPGGGNGKLLLKARGMNMTLPGPADTDRYFLAEPTVTVQIENSAGGCWSTSFDATGSVLNTPTLYKAKR